MPFGELRAVMHCNRYGGGKTTRVEFMVQRKAPYQALEMFLNDSRFASAVLDRIGSGVAHGTALRKSTTPAEE